MDTFHSEGYFCLYLCPLHVRDHHFIQSCIRQAEIAELQRPIEVVGPALVLWQWNRRTTVQVVAQDPACVCSLFHTPHDGLGGIHWRAHRDAYPQTDRIPNPGKHLGSLRCHLH